MSKQTTRDEALTLTIEYMGGDVMAADVWLGKYALKDTEGTLLEKTPEDMHWRIASELERADSKYTNGNSKEFYFSLLDKFGYVIPQGSPMFGIGNTHQIVSLSNCFVIGVEGDDSYGGIMLTDEEQVQLMKRRGGVGHDLGHIRPKDSKVKNGALTSGGIVPFMERYSNTTREVAQGGRRGALMLSCPISHPEIENFIDAKMEQGKVTGANISVKITDDFMETVEADGIWTMKFDLQDGTSITKEVPARKLWDKIIHNAWKSAEPGVMFWSQMIRESIAECYAKYGFDNISTNPCGELLLCRYDSCRLTVLNLYNYVINPFTKEATFNWELFKEHSNIIIRIMDNIVDLELEKIDSIIEKIKNDPESEAVKRTEYELWLKIREKCEQGRRTGVGITAEGDMLAALGYRYGTPEATDFAVEVHKTLAIEVFRGSVQLAKERGHFPIWEWELEKDNPFINRILNEAPEIREDLIKYGRRNIALLTIAPTGTVSIMTQTTSGIEPVFLPAYRRRRKINPSDKNSRVDYVDEVGDSWEMYNVFHHKFIDWYMINHKLEGIETREEYEKYLRNLNEEEIKKIVEVSPYHKATSNDVDWVEKIRMQGAIQKWIDHSISCTVNLPNEVTEELVSQVYMEGWKAGCKGVTVYRDGSRGGVLISMDDKTTKVEFKDNHAIKRPKKVDADVIRFTNSGEKWIAFVGLVEGRPYEIFTGKVEDLSKIPNSVESGVIEKVKNEEGISSYIFSYKDGDKRISVGDIKVAFSKQWNDTTKFLSAILRHGIPIVQVVDILGKLNLDGDFITTWKAGIKRILKRYVAEGTKIEGKKCSDCGSQNIQFSDGCEKCMDCGSSKCG